MDKASMRTTRRRQFLKAVAVAGGTALTAGCAGAASSHEPVAEGDIEAYDAAYGSFDHARTLAEISKSTTFVVGVCSDARPHAFLNGDGNYVGLDAAYAECVAWDIGAYVRYVETDPADIGSYLKAHKVDAVICSTALPAPDCLQVTPFVASRQAIVTAEDAGVKAQGDLTGKKVAVCAGTHAERYMGAESGGSEVVVYPSYTTAFQALRLGAVSAVCADQAIARAWKKGNKGFAVALDNLGEPASGSIQLAPDAEELLPHLNDETFALIKSGQVLNAYNKHVAPNIDGADYKAILLPAKDPNSK